MYCTHCGAQNPDEGRFCTKCGHPLSHVDEEQSPTETSQPEHAPAEPQLDPASIQPQVEEPVEHSGFEEHLGADAPFEPMPDESAAKASKAPIIVGIAVVAVALIIGIVLVIANPFAKSGSTTSDEPPVTQEQTASKNAADYIYDNDKVRLAAFMELDGQEMLSVFDKLGYKYVQDRLSGFVGADPQTACINAHQDGVPVTLAEDAYVDVPVIAQSEEAWTWRMYMEPTHWDTIMEESGLDEPVYLATATSTADPTNDAALAVYKDADGNPIIVSMFDNGYYTQVHISNAAAFDEGTTLAYSNSAPPALKKLPKTLVNGQGFEWTVVTDGFFDELGGKKAFDASDYTDKVGHINPAAFIELNGSELAEVVKKAGIRYSTHPQSGYGSYYVQISGSAPAEFAVITDDFSSYDSMSPEELADFDTIGNEERPLCYSYQMPGVSSLETPMQESGYLADVTHQARNVYEDRTMVYVLPDEDGNTLFVDVTLYRGDHPYAMVYVCNEAFVKAQDGQRNALIVLEGVDTTQHHDWRQPFESIQDLWDNLNPKGGNPLQGFEIIKEPALW